ncbi:hypothetical protein MRX96_012209 [Rhipicephalus microplus]
MCSLEDKRRSRCVIYVTKNNGFVFGCSSLTERRLTCSSAPTHLGNSLGSPSGSAPCRPTRAKCKRRQRVRRAPLTPPRCAKPNENEKKRKRCWEKERIGTLGLFPCSPKAVQSTADTRLQQPGVRLQGFPAPVPYRADCLPIAGAIFAGVSLPCLHVARFHSVVVFRGKRNSCPTRPYIVASSQKGISLWTDNDFGCGTVLLCSCPPLLSQAHQRRLPFLKRLPELGFQVELALGLLVRRRQLRRRGWAQAQRLRVPTLPREVLGTLRQVEEISGYLRRSSSNDLRLLTSH